LNLIWVMPAQGSFGGPSTLVNVLYGRSSYQDGPVPADSRAGKGEEVFHE